MTLQTSTETAPAVNRLSMMAADTAREARSTRDSILSLYSHWSYHERILKPREGEYAMTTGMSVDLFNGSSITDTFGDLNAVAKIPEVDEKEVDNHEQLPKRLPKILLRAWVLATVRGRIVF